VLYPKVRALAKDLAPAKPVNEHKTLVPKPVPKSKKGAEKQ
jgi:hypothetical protein